MASSVYFEAASGDRSTRKILIDFGGLITKDKQTSEEFCSSGTHLVAVAAVFCIQSACAGHSHKNVSLMSKNSKNLKAVAAIWAPCVRARDPVGVGTGALVVTFWGFFARYRVEFRGSGAVLRARALAVTRWPDLGLVSVRLLANPPPAVHGTPRRRPKAFILASLPLSVAHCSARAVTSRPDAHWKNYAADYSFRRVLDAARATVETKATEASRRPAPDTAPGEYTLGGGRVCPRDVLLFCFGDVRDLVLA